MTTSRSKIYLSVILTLSFVIALSLIVFAADGTSECGACNGVYEYTLEYEPWTETQHSVRYWCSNCGMDQNTGLAGENHTMSNGVCTKCGYDDGSGTPEECSHSSTSKSWSGCNWTEYCTSCGETVKTGTTHSSTYRSWSGCDYYDYCSSCSKLMSSGTSHSSTTRTWSGCDYKDYCSSCGDLVKSGTSHGSYSYGAWEYYSSTRHRRMYSCDDCGEGSYSYGYHSAEAKSVEYSDTQHKKGRYCSTCSSFVGTTSYEDHTFTYGSWTSYSGTQHRRSKTCSSCGYSTYEYASHSLTNGSWSSVSGTEHKRTNTCSCGYSKSETGTHADTDNNGSCDACKYLMSHFSVTVPASMPLAMSENGTVYAASDIMIINNSSGAVEVTEISVTASNGWRLVPYAFNMAEAKVDSKLISFILNGTETTLSGDTEVLDISEGWSIAKGSSLSLVYGAKVSATSKIIENEDVLMLVFVVGWAE